MTRSLLERLRGAAYTALTSVRGGIHPDALRLEYAIGLYEGASPWSLAPAAKLRCPLLTRNEVHDVTAAFVADPFLHLTSDGWHLFFEVFNWGVHRGEIGLASSPDGRRWKYEQIVLREPFHLSYPFVFDWDGQTYLIPESGQAGRTALYRANPYPARWERAAVLLEGPFADVTVFHQNGLWWLFACSQPETHAELRLFWSESLTGTWREHPANPIVSGDPKRARPAGRIIEFDGRVFRLAQDCLPEYGTAVRAFEIHELSPERYTETEIAASPILGPGSASWNRSGMHHVDAHRLDDGRWVAAVDGWVRYRP